MLGHHFTTEVNALLEKQRKDRGNAFKKIHSTMDTVERKLGGRLDAALDGILTTQRRLEDECLAMGKNQVQYHQKIIRWKAEYKRFQSELEDMQKFEQWLQYTEENMHTICGKLEYVCFELNKDGNEDQIATSAPPPSLFD